MGPSGISSIGARVEDGEPSESSGRALPSTSLGVRSPESKELEPVLEAGAL